MLFIKFVGVSVVNIALTSKTISEEGNNPRTVNN
jgi:hypothetical protein